MADEKKPDAKPAAPPPPPQNDAFVEIVSFIVVLMVLMAVVNGIINFVNTSKIFANGWSGLTPRGILLSHTRPIASLSNPIGSRIVSINTTDVYNSPDGRKIGSQKVNARGKILQGPVTVNGVRYWYVDFDKDPDGWVKESDIAYLESEPNFFERMLISLLNIIWYVKIILIFFCVVAIFCIIYLSRKLTELKVNEAKLLYPQSPQVIETVSPQWTKILSHTESLNENDWRQAIIEADIMLEDILDRLSLPGETMSEKLKAVEKSDFTTIDNAWEAHKIRNQIAHEGSAFALSQRKTKEVIALYQSVFEEFKVI